MQQQLAALGPDAIEDYAAFRKYSKLQYDITERGYFAHGLDTFWDFVKFYGLRDARGLDYSNHHDPRH